MATDNRFKIIIWLALACILLDQLSKIAVLKYIPYHSSITIIPGFFDLVHVLNRGAAFGFLNRSDINWQFWLFLVATLLACWIIILTTSKTVYNKWLFTGFGLILGGAAGNLIDRVRFRAVVDFIDLYIGSGHWPAFNIADMAICLGAVLSGITIWRMAKFTADQKEQI